MKTKDFVNLLIGLLFCASALCYKLYKKSVYLENKVLNAEYVDPQLTLLTRLEFVDSICVENDNLKTQLDSLSEVIIQKEFELNLLLK